MMDGQREEEFRRKAVLISETIRKFKSKRRQILNKYMHNLKLKHQLKNNPMY